MQKIFFLSLIALSALSLSACGNTANGVGQDMSEWGQTIQETF